MTTRSLSKITPNVLLAVAIVVFSGLVGCGEDTPVSRDDIFLKQMELPTLYLTAQSGKRVIAPANKGVFVDEATGEICWPAIACHNPKCPGRGLDGEVFLFVIPTPGATGQSDGTVTIDPSKVAPPNGTDGLCPECLRIRKPSNETAELKQKYVNWVKPYVLPEAAEQLKEIEAARIERWKARRKK